MSNEYFYQVNRKSLNLQFDSFIYNKSFISPNALVQKMIILILYGLIVMRRNIQNTRRLEKRTKKCQTHRKAICTRFQGICCICNLSGLDFRHIIDVRKILQYQHKWQKRKYYVACFVLMYLQFLRNLGLRNCL